MKNLLLVSNFLFKIYFFFCKPSRIRNYLLSSRHMSWVKKTILTRSLHWLAADVLDIKLPISLQTPTGDYTVKNRSRNLIEKKLLG